VSFLTLSEECKKTERKVVGIRFRKGKNFLILVAPNREEGECLRVAQSVGIKKGRNLSTFGSDRSKKKGGRGGP